MTIFCRQKKKFERHCVNIGMRPTHKQWSKTPRHTYVRRHDLFFFTKREMMERTYEKWVLMKFQALFFGYCFHLVRITFFLFYLYALFVQNERRRPSRRWSIQIGSHLKFTHIRSSSYLQCASKVSIATKTKLTLLRFGKKKSTELKKRLAPNTCHFNNNSPEKSPHVLEFDV